jgi:hypothetical protein
MKIYRNTFAGWARNVIAEGKRHGKSDEQIARWIKAYARKNKIPRGTYHNIGPLLGIYSRGPYGVKLKTNKRAEMGRQLFNSPRMQVLMTEVRKEIRLRQMSVLRTLRNAKDQGEDLAQVKREIITAISNDWSKQSISDFISAEDFIKRVFPELLQEETT